MGTEVCLAATESHFGVQNCLRIRFLKLRKLRSKSDRSIVRPSVFRVNQQRSSAQPTDMPRKVLRKAKLPTEEELAKMKEEVDTMWASQVPYTTDDGQICADIVLRFGYLSGTITLSQPADRSGLFNLLCMYSLVLSCCRTHSIEWHCQDWPSQGTLASLHHRVGDLWRVPRGREEVHKPVVTT